MDYEWLKLEEEKRYTQFFEEKFNVPLISIWAENELEGTDSEKMFAFIKTSLMPINEKYGKKLYPLCKEVLENLKLPLNFAEFFISNEPEFNAKVKTFKKEERTIILMRGLVENSPIEELKFVVGHEIGHTLLNHICIKNVLKFLYGEGEKMPMFISSLFRYWEKLAEISADRFGLLATRDIEVAVRALFRISSGLSEDYLNLTCEEIIEFAKERFKILKEEKFQHDLPYPVIPVRILSLVEFYNSDLYRNFVENGKIIEDKNLSERMGVLVDSLQKHFESEADFIFALFLASAGIIMMSADKKIDETEYNTLCNILANYIHFPPSMINEMLKYKKITETMQETARIIREKYPLAKGQLLKALVLIMIRDGKILDEEFNVFMKIAVDELHFSPSEALKILINAFQNSDRFLRPFV